MRPHERLPLSSLGLLLNGQKKKTLPLTVHNTETSEYIDGPPDTDNGFAELTARLYEKLIEMTSFAPTRPPRKMEESTARGRPGRMSVVQGLYRDRKMPAYLMEQRIAYNPKLGRLPTIEDRKRFGAELVRAIDATLSR